MDTLGGGFTANPSQMLTNLMAQPAEDFRLLYLA